MCGNTTQPHIRPIRAFSRGKSVRNAYGKYSGFTTRKRNATVVLEVSRYPDHPDHPDHPDRPLIFYTFTRFPGFSAQIELNPGLPMVCLGGERPWAWKKRSSCCICWSMMPMGS